jgi:hypothetical protein
MPNCEARCSGLYRRNTAGASLPCFRCVPSMRGLLRIPYGLALPSSGAIFFARTLGKCLRYAHGSHVSLLIVHSSPDAHIHIVAETNTVSSSLGLLYRDTEFGSYPPPSIQVHRQSAYPPPLLSAPLWIGSADCQAPSPDGAFFLFLWQAHKVRRHSGQAEAKTAVCENRSGTYVRVREHRKRSGRRFAAQHHLNAEHF